MTRLKKRCNRSGRVLGRIVLALALMLQPGALTYGQSPDEATQASTLSPGKAPSAGSIKESQFLRQTLSLQLKNIPIEKALHEIASRAGLALGWSKTTAPLSGNVTLNLKDVTVEEALAKVLEGQGVYAKLSNDGQTILIVAVNKPVLQDKSDVQKVGTIIGRVIDSVSKTGIEGATITVQDIKISVTSNDKGEFVIRNLPVGSHTISVRLVGYKTAVTKVDVESGGTARITVYISASSTMLSEVVTTASGVQRRLEVGNDITVLNVDSIIQNAPITSITDLLETRVPGLTVQRSSGSPGDPAKIRIRGEGSITRSSEPIVIVDGIRVTSDESLNKGVQRGSGVGGDKNFSAPSAIDQIDPNSIETIEVQKGPSASALYGSDAANGVIVITTKRGKKGTRSLSGRVTRGVTTLPGSFSKNYFIFGRGFDGYNDQFPYGCRYPICAHSIIDSVVPYQAFDDPLFNVFDKGKESGITVTASGGIDAFSYSITGSSSTTTGYLRLPEVEVRRWNYFNTDPIPEWSIKPEMYKSSSISSNFTFNPNSNINIVLGQTLSRSVQSKSGVSNNAIASLSKQYIDTARIFVQGSIISNPFLKARSETMSFRPTFGISYQVASWLPVIINGGLDFSDRNNESLEPRSRLPTPADTNGRWDRSTALNLRQSFSVGLGAGGVRIPVGGGRVIRMLSGINVNRSSSSNQSMRADSLSPGLGIADRFTSGTQRRTSQLVAGWYIEPKIDFQSRFFLVPGFRFDGSNTSGSRAGLSGFPRLSFSWLASDEPFWPFKSMVEMFRLRMALGFAGRLPSAGEHLRLFKEETFNYFNPPEMILGLTSIGNTKLVPERTREVELGFDADFWANRIKWSVTYSRGLTSDALVTFMLAPSVLGGVNQPVNIGNVRKENLEFTADIQVFDSRRVGWNIQSSFSQHRNVLTGIKDGIYAPYNKELGVKFAQGYPVNAIWYVPALSYYDVNGNGVIDNRSEIRYADTLVYAGVPYPRYELNLSSSVSVLEGRVNVSAAMKYSDGVLRQRGGAGGADLMRYFGCAYCDSSHVDAIGLAEMATQIGGAGRAVQVLDILSFNYLTVRYSLPQELLRALKVSRSSVSLQGSNLGMKSNYKGKDPRVGDDYGIDSGQLPLPREWKLVVSLGM